MRLPDPSQGTLLGQVLGLLLTCAVLCAVIRLRQGYELAALLDDPGLLWPFTTVGSPT